MRSSLEQLLQKSKIAEMVELTIFDRNGWKFVSLLRILPMNAYNLMNYILGITSLDFCGLIISDLAILPNVILYCLVGVFLRGKVERVLFITMIVEIICSVLPILWWIAWIYWNVSNEYDKARESMVIPHPSDIWRNQQGQRESQVILEQSEYDFDDNISNL